MRGNNNRFHTVYIERKKKLYKSITVLLTRILVINELSE